MHDRRGAVSVTVALPVHNRPDDLRQALRSVAAQGVDGCETLVVDDGSTPPVALSGDEAPGLRIVRHETNKGAAAARNTGVAEAQGPFVAFLDSDDQWEPGKLATQLQVMRSAPAAVAGVFTPFCWQGAPERRFNANLEVAAGGWFDHFLLGCRLGPGSTLMVRRDVYQAIGPQAPDLVRYEDWDWLLRASRHHDFAVSTGPGAVLARSGRPTAESVMSSLEIIGARWLPGLAGDRRRRLAATLALERSVALRWSGRTLTATAALLRAATTDPGTVAANIRWRLGR